MISDQKALFVIGAQKAGTTWLRANLYPLNYYSLGPIKELHYYSQFSTVDKFDWCATHRLEQFKYSGVLTGISQLALNELSSLSALSEDAYYDLLNFDKEKIFCDFSPEYCMLESFIFDKIVSDFPNSKFIYILRNPVDRAMSQIRMQSIGIYDLDHLLSIEEHTHILRQSKYTDNLLRINRVVAPENLLIINYEDISKRPYDLLKDIHFFVTGQTISNFDSFEDINKVIFSFSDNEIADHLRVYNLIESQLQQEVDSWKLLISNNNSRFSLNLDCR